MAAAVAELPARPPSPQLAHLTLAPQQTQVSPRRRPGSAAIAATPLGKLPRGCVDFAEQLLAADSSVLQQFLSDAPVRWALRRQGIEAKELLNVAARAADSANASPAEQRYSRQLLAQVIWEADLCIADELHAVAQNAPAAPPMALVTSGIVAAAAPASSEGIVLESTSNNFQQPAEDSSTTEVNSAENPGSAANAEVTVEEVPAIAHSPHTASRPQITEGSKRRMPSTERARLIRKEQEKEWERRWCEKEKAVSHHWQQRERLVEAARKKARQQNQRKEQRHAAHREEELRRREELWEAWEKTQQQTSERVARSKSAQREVTELMCSAAAVRSAVLESNRRQLSEKHAEAQRARSEKAARAQTEADERRKRVLTARSTGPPQLRAAREVARRQAERVMRIHEVEREDLREHLERDKTSRVFHKGGSVGVNGAMSVEDAISVSCAQAAAARSPSRRPHSAGPCYQASAPPPVPSFASNAGGSFSSKSTVSTAEQRTVPECVRNPVPPKAAPPASRRPPPRTSACKAAEAVPEDLNAAAAEQTSSNAPEARLPSKPPSPQMVPWPAVTAACTILPRDPSAEGQKTSGSNDDHFNLASSSTSARPADRWHSAPASLCAEALPATGSVCRDTQQAQEIQQENTDQGKDVYGAIHHLGTVLQSMEMGCDMSENAEDDQVAIDELGNIPRGGFRGKVDADWIVQAHRSLQELLLWAAEPDEVEGASRENTSNALPGDAFAGLSRDGDTFAGMSRDTITGTSADVQDPTLTTAAEVVADALAPISVFRLFSKETSDQAVSAAEAAVHDEADMNGVVRQRTADPVSRASLKCAAAEAAARNATDMLDMIMQQSNPPHHSAISRGSMDGAAAEAARDVTRDLDMVRQQSNGTSCHVASKVSLEGDAAEFAAGDVIRVLDIVRQQSKGTSYQATSKGSVEGGAAETAARDVTGMLEVVRQQSKGTSYQATSTGSMEGDAAEAVARDVTGMLEMVRQQSNRTSHQATSRDSVEGAAAEAAARDAAGMLEMARQQSQGTSYQTATQSSLDATVAAALGDAAGIFEGSSPVESTDAGAGIEGSSIHDLVEDTAAEIVASVLEPDQVANLLEGTSRDDSTTAEAIAAGISQETVEDAAAEVAATALASTHKSVSLLEAREQSKGASYEVASGASVESVAAEAVAFNALGELKASDNYAKILHESTSAPAPTQFSLLEASQQSKITSCDATSRASVESVAAEAVACDAVGMLKASDHYASILQEDAGRSPSKVTSYEATGRSSIESVAAEAVACAAVGMLDSRPEINESTAANAAVAGGSHENVESTAAKITATALTSMHDVGPEVRQQSKGTSYDSTSRASVESVAAETVACAAVGMLVSRPESNESTAAKAVVVGAGHEKVESTAAKMTATELTSIHNVVRAPEARQQSKGTSEEVASRASTESAAATTIARDALGILKASDHLSKNILHEDTACALVKCTAAKTVAADISNEIIESTTVKIAAAAAAPAATHTLLEPSQQSQEGSEPPASSILHADKNGASVKLAAAEIAAVNSSIEQNVAALPEDGPHSKSGSCAGTSQASVESTTAGITAAALSLTNPLSSTNALSLTNNTVSLMEERSVCFDQANDIPYEGTSSRASRESEAAEIAAATLSPKADTVCMPEARSHHSDSASHENTSRASLESAAAEDAAAATISSAASYAAATMCEIGKGDTGLSFAAPPRTADPGDTAAEHGQQFPKTQDSAAPCRIPPGDIANLLTESEELEAAELIGSQGLAACAPRCDWV